MRLPFVRAALNSMSGTLVPGLVGTEAGVVVCFRLPMSSFIDVTNVS